jgi:hypothetical protein
MQTFLPYADFDRCAEILDTRRLGKQRVEVLQIMRALTVEGYAWKHHPAVLMWKGHEAALVAYGAAICREWCRRGFADTCQTKILVDARAAGVRRVRSQATLDKAGRLPPWLGDPALHRSHQSSLVRKDPGHYGPLFPGVPDDLPYEWPVRIEPARRRSSPPRRMTAR